jgi:hypothetical protein
VQYRHCGRQIPAESTFCTSCGSSIAFNPSNQEPRWVLYKDTRVFIKKVDNFKFHIAAKVDVDSLQYVGEVQSEDMGRSWKFRLGACIESKYILEGVCDDLDDGIRSIMRALWG